MTMDARIHFVHEKRFLLTDQDLARVEKLMRAIRKASGGTVQLSQLVRAALIALQAAKPELERMISKGATLERPSFTDPRGMLEFERELAELLSRAIAASVRGRGRKT